MKKYKNYMDHIRVDETQHARFLQAMKEAAEAGPDTAPSEAEDLQNVRRLSSSESKVRKFRRRIGAAAAVLALALVSLTVFPRLSSTFPTSKAADKNTKAGVPGQASVTTNSLPGATALLPGATAAAAETQAYSEAASVVVTADPAATAASVPTKNATRAATTASSDTDSRTDTKAASASPDGSAVSPTGSPAQPEEYVTVELVTSSEPCITFYTNGVITEVLNLPDESVLAVREWIEKGLLIPVTAVPTTVEGTENHKEVLITLDGTVYSLNDAADPEQLQTVRDRIGQFRTAP